MNIIEVTLIIAISLHWGFATGGFLAMKRTGNYDVDFFTKIIGWVMLMFGVYGIFELVRFYI